MSFDLLRQRFVERRKSLGITQEAIARTMGTTQSAVSDLESGRTRDPGLNTLARWAAAIDLTLAVHLSELRRTVVPIAPRRDDEAETIPQGMNRAPSG